MRRVFALLLLAPLLVSCADSATPVTPAGASLSEGEAPTEEPMHPEGDWPVEENWFTPNGAIELADEEVSLLSANDLSAQSASEPRVMTLGDPDVGTTYPGGTHDMSFHARWKIVPGAVMVDSGGKVTFKVNFGHRVAIYDNGVRPEDIQPTPGPLLLYPKGRVFLQPNPTPQFTLKFARPGKYLVVCAINKHFFEAKQYAWVIVK